MFSKKNKKYLKFDAEGKVVGWRFYMEAKDIIGERNIKKLKKAGLQVLPANKALDEVIGVPIQNNSAFQNLKIQSSIPDINLSWPASDLGKELQDIVLVFRSLGLSEEETKEAVQERISTNLTTTFDH